MKKLRSMIALVLCFALVFSMAGCQSNPTSESTEPIPTEPSAADIYAQAKAPVAGAADLTLRITSNKVTTVGGEDFREESSQTLSILNAGTENIMFTSTDSVTYGDLESYVYDEVFANGVLYLTVDKQDHFSGEMTAEESLSRYVPALLIDETLYGSAVLEETTNGSTIRFTQPTAGEDWALPEGAELVDASGAAYLSASGELQKTTYAITYTYGPAQVKMDVEVYVNLETVEIQVPENTEDYTLLDWVDAVRASDLAVGTVLQSHKVSSQSMESTMSQAAAVVMNQGTGFHYYGQGSNLLAKITTNVYLMDYSTAQSQQYEMEELFLDGKYTYAENGAEPQAESGITPTMIQRACDDMLLANLVSYSLWENATATNLGSLIYVECPLTEEAAGILEDAVCKSLFGDPELLTSLSSAYVTNEATAYFAIDLYTGLPTAAGYYYSGTHTIQGQECELTFQVDQSFDAPSLTVYKTITDELAPETEPENKATPLFYHVTGPDGQEMWMLGTIHVGDERTAFLPQEIYDAFNASDALAVEFNSNAFDDQIEEDEEFSDKISDYYFYSDGTTAADHLDAEVYEAALMYMKATGNHNMNTEYLKPSIWANSIDNFFLRQGRKLVGDKGMDNRLLTMAEEQGKEILDVESGEFQIGMMTGYSDGLQELLLSESISYDPSEYWSSVEELYESWCRGDEAELRERLADEEVDTSEMTEEELAEYEEAKPYLEEYENAMSDSRNVDMLEVAKGYLESGKTVFFAVGLAHLLEDDGLVDALREAGYTVELVTFN